MPTMLLYVTLGLAIVLATRTLARRLFGAGPAFTLWLLPPLLASLPWLHASPPAWLAMPVLRVWPDAPVLLKQAGSMDQLPQWPLLLWWAGSAFFLLRLSVHYVRLLRQGRKLPESMRRALPLAPGRSDGRHVRLHPSGPAVLWAPHSLVLLPPDFLERFDPVQRRLVLQHEHAHLRRGDALWSLLGELALALLWFHPLAWLALPRLRLDQELACDEYVLRQSPDDEADYAHALLHSTGMDVMPVLIPWLAQPQLKERLSMIQSHRPGALRRHIGFVALALLMTGGACVVQATTRHARPVEQSGPDANMAFNSKINPQYPASAVKNHEQGTVVLDVLVGTDGKPLQIVVNAATQAGPDLIKAASDAAMQWRFSPQMKNGKPIQGYARVPITFSLDSTPPAAPAKPVPPAPPASSNS